MKHSDCNVDGWMPRTTYGRQASARTTHAQHTHMHAFPTIIFSFQKENEISIVFCSWLLHGIWMHCKVVGRHHLPMLPLRSSQEEKCILFSFSLALFEECQIERKKMLYRLLNELHILGADRITSSSYFSFSANAHTV